MKTPSRLCHRLFLGALCSTLLVTPPARAHTLPVSTLTLIPGEKYLDLELTLNPFELVFFSELDANKDGELDPGEWIGQGEAIAWRILEGLELRVNERTVTAEFAGLSQSYESHHVALRAHFAVDARRARVSLTSRLATLTSSSHVTEVTFGAGERVQTARLDAKSIMATFDPIEATDAFNPVAAGSGISAAASAFNAFELNETAVMALLVLLLFAGVPPTLFCVLVRRSRHPRRQVVPASSLPATVGIH